MTRARGSDEVEEEGAGAGVSSTLGASSFKDLFLDWDGPDLCQIGFMEAACLPTDADEEETAAPITSAAHPRGVKKDTRGVSFAFPEGGRCWSEGKQQ